MPDTDHLLRATFLLTGTAVMSLGSGLIGIYGFEQEFLMVFMGLLLSVFGYKICQGVNMVTESGGVKLMLLDWKKGYTIDAREHMYMLTGGLSMSYGVILFIQMVNSLDLSLGLVSGVFCLGGYMIAHLGINDTLV